jgi:hypothetical protein
MGGQLIDFEEIFYFLRSFAAHEKMAATRWAQHFPKGKHFRSNFALAPPHRCFACADGL